MYIFLKFSSKYKSQCGALVEYSTYQVEDQEAPGLSPACVDKFSAGMAHQT